MNYLLLEFSIEYFHTVLKQSNWNHKKMKPEWGDSCITTPGDGATWSFGAPTNFPTCDLLWVLSAVGS